MRTEGKVRIVADYLSVIDTMHILYYGIPGSVKYSMLRKTIFIVVTQTNFLELVVNI
jgi:hypothetical protein